MPPLRRLMVLRHAKSARPAGVGDHDRPLSPRGRRDARAVGQWLSEADWLPDLALCSTARRARETWDLASAVLGTPPPVRHEPRLYHPPPQDLLAAVRAVPRHTHTVVLIGHNPSLQELIQHLAGDGFGDLVTRAHAKFPTAAIAVLTWHGTWQSLTPGTALLTDLAVPRAPRP